MSRAAKSMIAWAAYVFLAGITLLAFPNVALRLAGLAPTQEPWIRVVGVLTLSLSYLYLRAGLGEFKPYFAWSTHNRIALICFLALLVIMRLAPWQLLLFGIVDLIGAAWTWWAMHHER